MFTKLLFFIAFVTKPVDNSKALVVYKQPKFYLRGPNINKINN